VPTLSTGIGTFIFIAILERLRLYELFEEGVYYLLTLFAALEVADT
jgi:hypothetical protein